MITLNHCQKFFTTQLLSTAVIMSSTQIFQKLKNPPALLWPINKPQYHGKNGNHIFILIDNNNAQYPSGSNITQGLLQYNLDTQQTINSYQALDTLLEENELCIDEEENIIYINESCDYEHFPRIFNINTKQWTIYMNDQHREFYKQNFCFIPSPINKLHITCKDHFEYDITTNKLNKLNNDTSLLKIRTNDLKCINGIPTRFLYRQSSRQLIRFDTDEVNIFVSTIHAVGHASNWSKYPTKLPRFSGLYKSFDVLLAWDQIIFWLDYSSTNKWSISCLDLDHNEKWYKSTAQIPEFKYPPCSVKDNDNNIHLITFQKEKNAHYKALLTDILPLQIFKLNQIKYNPLITAYIRQLEKAHKMTFIPIYLKRLIANFYPIFT